jgi:hypothetical protein
LKVFTLAAPGGRQYSFQQIVRTAKGSLLAMGPVLLRSTDEGQTWSVVDGFRSVPGTDTAEGRYLTALSGGGVLVTYGIGRDNKGLSYNWSDDDGLTWNNDRTVVLLPDTSVAARYYSARTIELDDRTVGTVFMNGQGVHFLKVSLDRLAR